MWQDWTFAAAGLVFVAGLIPTLLDKRSEVPRWRTAVPTGLMLMGVAYTHVTLGLLIAACSNVLTASVWFSIAVLRPIRNEPTHVFVLQEGEEGVVLEYREWRRKQQIQQQLLVEAQHEIKILGGGCGACPARGACDEEEPLEPEA